VSGPDLPRTLDSGASTLRSSGAVSGPNPISTGPVSHRSSPGSVQKLSTDGRDDWVESLETRSAGRSWGFGKRIHPHFITKDATARGRVSTLFDKPNRATPRFRKSASRKSCIPFLLSRGIALPTE
jgi:hypothetical protein